MPEFEEQSFIQKLFAARRASRPLNPAKIPPDNPRYVPNSAAELGLAVGASPLALVDVFVNEIKSDVNKNNLKFKRFGGSEDVIDLQWKVLQNLQDNSGDPDFLKKLGITDRDSFAKYYTDWANANTGGVGKYSIVYKPSDWVFHPLKTGLNSAKMVATKYAWDKFEQAVGQETPSKVSLLNISESAPHLERFLNNELDRLKRVSDDSTSPAGVRADARMRYQLLSNQTSSPALKKAVDDQITTSGLYKTLRFAFGPPGPDTHALGGSLNGRLGHVLQLTRDPIGYTAKNYIWGTKGAHSLGIKRVYWGFPGMRYFNQGLWKAPFRIVNSLIIFVSRGRINFGKILSVPGYWAKMGASALLKKSANLAFKFLPNLALSALGLVGGIAIGAFKFAVSKISFLPLVIAVVSALAVPLGILTIAMFVFMPLFFLGGGTAAAAPTGDLLITATASKTQEVSAGDSIVVTLNVSAFSDDLGQITVLGQLDDNLIFGGDLGGGGTSGNGIQWPGFTLAKGQSRQFVFTVISASGMTRETEATINFTARSPGLISSAALFFNRSGNGIGADGRYAFPVLKSYRYFWYNCHWHANYNARDIRTDPAGGTPVVAVTSGLIVLATISVGPAVILHGDDGMFYYYGHLRAQGRPAPGKVVSLGEIIGEIAGADEKYAENQGVAHVHFSISAYNDHNFPEINAGDFLNRVDGTSIPPC